MEAGKPQQDRGAATLGSVAIYFSVLTSLVLTSHAYFKHHFKEQGL